MFAKLTLGGTDAAAAIAAAKKTATKAAKSDKRFKCKFRCPNRSSRAALTYLRLVAEQSEEHMILPFAVDLKIAKG
ncbi:MAG TPA: hypothetical protein VH000_06680, partial [Rhizomicrobium sp.]|nr:hypothetical protein [Rhizomicrobium sp.]